MFGNAIGIGGVGADVARDRVFRAEVGGVGALRVGIPLAGEDAGAADALEADAQATDPGKQVDEAEGRGVRGRGHERDAPSVFDVVPYHAGPDKRDPCLFQYDPQLFADRTIPGQGYRPLRPSSRNLSAFSLMKPSASRWS